MTWVWTFFSWGIFACFAGVFTFGVVLRARKERKTVGFLHPYCNAGGGGERVLWTAVKALVDENSDIKILVYSGGVEGIEEVLKKVQNDFGIRIKNQNVQKVRLLTRPLIEAKRYPVATLIFQFIGAVVIMVEALLKRTPSLMIDSHGQAFGYFCCKLGGIPVVAYVHYPVISTDMISKVREMRPSYNNSSIIASTTSVSYLKLFYYKVLMKWYSTCGWFCDLALCNSSWTQSHIRSIWRCDQAVVFPPCDVSNFLSLPLDSPKEPRVVSIGQFRPEKDHELQILSFSEVLKNPSLSHLKLSLIGSCRDQSDLARVNDLKSLANSLKISQNVEFFTNVSFSELMQIVQRSMVGLHSMWNEHFGICVVELMASGVITVAHNSAGPRLDIITDKVDGFLACNVGEYAECISQAVLRFEDLRIMREKAREKSRKFSQELFEEGFRRHLRRFLKGLL